MPRIEIKPERRADVTYSAHDGNLWVLPLTTAGISYCRSAMPAGAQRMGMYYLIGAGDATRVLCGLHADGGLVARQVGGPPVRMPLQHAMQRGAA